MADGTEIIDLPTDQVPDVGDLTEAASPPQEGGDSTASPPESGLSGTDSPPTPPDEDEESPPSLIAGRYRTQEEANRALEGANNFIEQVKNKSGAKTLEEVLDVISSRQADAALASLFGTEGEQDDYGLGQVFGGEAGQNGQPAGPAVPPSPPEPQQQTATQAAPLQQQGFDQQAAIDHLMTEYDMTEAQAGLYLGMMRENHEIKSYMQQQQRRQSIESQMAQDRQEKDRTAKSLSQVLGEDQWRDIQPIAEHLAQHPTHMAAPWETLGLAAIGLRALQAHQNLQAPRTQQRNQALKTKTALSLPTGGPVASQSVQTGPNLAPEDRRELTGLGLSDQDINASFTAEGEPIKRFTLPSHGG